MSALEPIPAVACSSCKATGVPIDLDVKATPPEHLCRKCLRKAKCDRCKRRVNRVMLQIPSSDGTYFHGWKFLCGRCNR